MPDITSRPYRPKMACEACVFGRGEHAAWCENHCPYQLEDGTPLRFGKRETAVWIDSAEKSGLETMGGTPQDLEEVCGRLINIIPGSADPPTPTLDNQDELDELWEV